MKGKLGVALLSIAATFAFASIVAAGPIPAVLVSGSMGESDVATSASAGSTNNATINIDWIVGNTNDAAFASWVGRKGDNGVAVVAGDWIYLYQAENDNVIDGSQTVDVDGDGDGDTVTATIIMSSYTIGFAKGVGRTSGDLAISGYTGKGVVPCAGTSTCNSDLDVGIAGYYPSHVIGAPVPADQPEPQLVNEEEGVCPSPDTFGPGGEFDNGTPGEYCFNPFPRVGGTLNGGSSSSLVLTGDTWSFGKPPHHESDVLWLASPNPPVYGVGAALSSGEIWRTGLTNTDGFTGQQVPVPSAAVPEPTTLSLFGLGLLGAIVAQRVVRRKRS